MSSLDNQSKQDAAKLILGYLTHGSEYFEIEISFR